MGRDPNDLNMPLSTTNSDSMNPPSFLDTGLALHMNRIDIANEIRFHINNKNNNENSK